MRIEYRVKKEKENKLRESRDKDVSITFYLTTPLKFTLTIVLRIAYRVKNKKSIREKKDSENSIECRVKKEKEKVGKKQLFLFS